MVDFVYKDYIENMIDNDEIIMFEENPLENVRGLSLDYDILINLSASQWKGLDSDTLIEEMGKTIVHEHIHRILKSFKIPLEQQEEICKIMAEQSATNRNI